jgi:hypothetical protein
VNTSSRIKKSVSRVWLGDFEVFENLLALETTCWFLFTGKDTASERSMHILQHFLATHKPPVPVVELRISEPEEASRLQIAFLPQLRLYHRGREIRRHRGIASMDVLAQFYHRSLK